MEEDDERESDDEAEEHARGRDDRSGKDLPGGSVAEEEDGVLEATVDQTTGDTAKDVADTCAEQQADDAGVRVPVQLTAHLETGQRPGQDEQEAEAFHEDQAGSGLESVVR